MIVCPYCDGQNIEGMDVCEQCGQPLVDMHLAPPGRHVERALLADRVSKLRPKTPIVVARETPVGDVLKLLVEQGIGCVFVVDDNAIVGVFSERDALKRIGTAATSLVTKPVAEFMTVNPQDLDEDAKIAFAVRMMDLGGYRHIPVVDAHRRPVGVISVRDILKYLTEEIAAGA
jgi:CBS domain-containing protein